MTSKIASTQFGSLSRTIRRDLVGVINEPEPELWKPFSFKKKCWQPMNWVPLLCKSSGLMNWVFSTCFNSFISKQFPELRGNFHHLRWMLPFKAVTSDFDECGGGVASGLLGGNVRGRWRPEDDAKMIHFKQENDKMI